MHAFAFLVLAAVAVDLSPPTIEHTPVASAPKGQALELRAEIEDPSGVFEASAFVRGVGEGPYTRYELASTDARVFTAQLPPGRLLTDVEYYLEAFDGQGNGPARHGSSEAPLRIAVHADLAPPLPGDALATSAATLPDDVAVESPSSVLGPIIVAGAGVAIAIAGAILVANGGAEVAEIDGRYAPGEGRLPADAQATFRAQSRGTWGAVFVGVGAAAVVGGVSWWLVPSLVAPSSGTPDDGFSELPAPGLQLRVIGRF